MGEGFFDRNLRRLLGRARQPVEARPLFREQLRLRLQQEAGTLRDDVAEAPTREVVTARRPAWRAAAAAILVIAAGGFGWWLWNGSARGEPVSTGCGRESPPLRVAADRRVVLEMRKG